MEHECGLFLIIDKTAYKVERVYPEDRQVKVSWNLRKKHEALGYCVHVDEFGSHCSCKSYVFKKHDSPEGCKHIQALRKVGLLPRLRQPQGASA